MDRTRIGPSAMTFINRGYSDDNINGVEMRTEQQRLGRPRLGNDDQTCCEAQSRAISHNIRHISEERNQRSSDRRVPCETSNAKQTRYCNCCIISLTIVILVAPLGISAYVFWRQNSIINSKCPDHLVDPSITPSMQQGQSKYSELKKLVKEVKELHKKYQELQTRGTQSGGNSPGGSIRDQRKARQNCSSRANRQYDKSIEDLKIRLTDKADNIQRLCKSKIAKLNRRIVTLQAGLQEETNVCKFKIENSTVVDEVKGRQKVQLNEEKNSASHFVGVTCCSDYNAANVTNSILEVNETLTNITYACYCARRQRCSVCYWYCSESSTQYRG
ncbi:uncharacterized protein LOC114522295 [Dendronephthya gigantea]|uniref:uncharacterized protein LOC114522295 n=1 Tax=Dendronephthya gigantea TaxID=151771 RepID=UPI00106B4F30|nr:uncharacterized protein LOC114522295 [Dendronephthya gigantea]